jgi:adenosylhomocysteine nucleosidase
MTAAETIPGLRCDAAVVFAIALEADAFAARVDEVRTYVSGGLELHAGRLQSRDVAWCVAGVGEKPAGLAARLLVLGHRPRRLISAGFAGGLDPAIPRGAVVRANRVMSERTGEILPLAAAGAAASGMILTTGGVVESAAAKRALHAETGAAIVDMETHAVAAVARDEGLPCVSVRVVSDDAGSDLPREVAALARPQSAFRRFGAAIGAIGRRPAAALDLWALYEHAVVDGKTLAAALAETITSPPASQAAP